MNDELYVDVKNKTLYVDKENINDFLLNIMRENNVNVCIGSPTVNHDHFHHSSYSAEQRMTDAMESAREHIPILHQVHYNTGGPTRTLSQEELLNKWKLDFKQILQQQYLNNVLLADSFCHHVNFNDLDRLIQREITREEFKKEILSRNRPKNNWFRRKHEKKRFIKGL